MTSTAWFTTVHDVLNRGGEGGFDRTAILPRGVSSLFIGADVLARDDANTHSILLVMSNEQDHAEVDNYTTLMKWHFCPTDDGLKWHDVPSRGWALVWKPHDKTKMAYFHGVQHRCYPRDIPRGVAQVSVVAFSAIPCSHAFDAERARAVFIVANDTRPDVVLFGAGVAENEDSMRMILEERRRVAPTCRIAFVGPTK